MATAPSPNDLTRQQLDELDALLQRMLSVPMPTETPAPSAAARTAFESAPAIADPPLPPSWRIDPPTAPQPTNFPTTPPALPRERPAPPLAITDPPSSVSLKFDAPAPEPPAPLKPAAKLPAPPVAPVIAPPPLPLAKSPVPSPKPAVAKPQAAPASAAPSLTPAPAAPPVPFLFLPFVAFNALFDAVCGLFGPPGRILRSGLFKRLYGLIGLGLLLYTVAHIAQLMKWVTLPVELPWPR